MQSRLALKGKSHANADDDDDDDDVDSGRAVKRDRYSDAQVITPFKTMTSSTKMSLSLNPSLRKTHDAEDPPFTPVRTRGLMHAAPPASRRSVRPRYSAEPMPSESDETEDSEADDDAYMEVSSETDKVTRRDRAD